MLKNIFLILLIIFRLGFDGNSQTVEDGLLDLRKMDLDKKRILLDGEWEFYWNELIPPESALFPAEKDYLHFPSIWNNSKTRRGVALDNFGFATYKLRILLPEERPDLAIYVKHVYSSYELFINGKKLASGGKVGTDRESSSPKWVPKIVNLPEKTDTVDLVLQISNFRHSKGGARESFVLAKEEAVEAHTNTVLAFDLLLCGNLIMAGLFFYALFLFGQREKTALYFSLFCLTFVYRIVGAEDYSLQLLFPDLDWLFSIKKEYLSLFVPPIFYALYTHALFPLKYYKVNPFYIFAGLSAIFAMVTILCPPKIFTTLVEPYLVLLLLGILLACYVYYKAYQKKLEGSKYAVISSGVALVIFTYKIILYFGSFQEVEFISFFGYLAFFFFQSLILFFIFTNSLKRAKEEAEHASRTKSDFLSMMSHEIRTPMNAVIGLSNYLIEDEPKKEQVETLNTLKFSAQNLLVIINDILDFNKIEAERIEFDYEPVHIRNLIASIRSVFLPIAKDKGLELSFTCDPRIPSYIICDQTRTSQVLTNLVSNALKFTHHGKVEVKLMVEGKGPGYICILFKVSDTGIGIPKEKQKDIFNSFTQASSSTNRQFGGTGLGLSITKKLLELQETTLHLNSTEGEGSEFYFSQKFGLSERDPRSETRLLEPLGKEKIEHDILLVEDNEINVMVAMKFLEKWGARVTVAKNGKEALDLIGTKDFKLILMDLQMPVMDGYQAVAEIRKQGIQTPIIALTATALLEEQKKIYEAGMDDYVTKPFDPTYLLSKILHFIH